MFRFGVVCGGASLYAPQAQNNVVRVAYEAMAAVLGGVQSMFTAAWDEPFALPTEESTTLALRTQQILAYETGVARTVDPLGGSYYVEALTDEMERKIVEIMDDIEEHGGMARAVEEGYVQRLIGDEAWRLQAAVEGGERPVVGVNRFAGDAPVPEAELYEPDEETLRRQLARLAGGEGRARRRVGGFLAAGAARGGRDRRREPDGAARRLRRSRTARSARSSPSSRTSGASSASRSSFENGRLLVGGPLAGVRVVDLCQVLAGPYATLDARRARRRRDQGRGSRPARPGAGDRAVLPRRAVRLLLCAEQRQALARRPSDDRCWAAGRPRSRPKRRRRRRQLPAGRDREARPLRRRPATAQSPS